MHQYAPSPHFQSLPSSNGDAMMNEGPVGMSHQSSVSSSASSSHKSSSKQARYYNHHHSHNHPYDDDGRINNGQQMNQITPGPIRRRISRACDQCNQLRTKCDGKLPCQHCVGGYPGSPRLLCTFSFRLRFFLSFFSLFLFFSIFAFLVGGGVVGLGLVD